MKKFFLLLFTIISISSISQNYISPFNFPLLLSGTFGELRSNHFHTGIDIKTESIEGKKPEDINPDVDGDFHPIYIKTMGGKIDGYAIPISGKGLWSTLYGYFAVESDGMTVKGITFYKHGETAGLGGEVDKPWFQNNFKGKKFVDNDGNLVGIQIMKGGVDDTSPEAYHQVDGISGATMTSKGLNNFLMNDLKTYESFFHRIRTSKGI